MRRQLAYSGHIWLARAENVTAEGHCFAADWGTIYICGVHLRQNLGSCGSPWVPVRAAGVPDYVPEEERFYATDEGYSTPPEEPGAGSPAMGSPMSHVSEARSPQAKHFSAAPEAEQGAAPSAEGSSPRPATAARR